MRRVSDFILDGEMVVEDRLLMLPIAYGTG